MSKSDDSDPLDGFVTVARAGELLDRHPNTIRRLVEGGGFGAGNVKRVLARIYIRESAVLALIKDVEPAKASA